MVQIYSPLEENIEYIVTSKVAGFPSCFLQKKQ